MSAITGETVVADVVLAHPATARVFHARGIDFCCGGESSIERACADRNLDPFALIQELEQAIAEGGPASPAEDPRRLPTRSLIARIVRRHHAYLWEAIPRIEALATKVAAVHGGHNPKLVELAREVKGLFETIQAHLEQEEAVLFPALTSGAGATSQETIAEELKAMREDHEVVGAALERIRALADGFAVPEWGCMTYRALFDELATLEQDVHEHVFLENSVLMPRFVPRGPGVRAAP